MNGLFSWVQTMVNLYIYFAALLPLTLCLIQSFLGAVSQKVTLAKHDGFVFSVLNLSLAQCSCQVRVQTLINAEYELACTKDFYLFLTLEFALSLFCSSSSSDLALLAIKSEHLFPYANIITRLRISADTGFVLCSH